MKHTFSVALIAGLAASGAPPLQAGPLDGPAARDADGVRVVNNYGAMVNVYAEDETGRLHKLGRVGIGSVEEFEIPEAVTEGSFRVKVYPSHPIWSGEQAEIGIKTNPIDPTMDLELTFWIEPDLAESVLEYRRN